MKNTLSVRQICFILAAYGAATKLLLYPAASVAAVGNALLFPALINLALQTVIIWSVAYLSSRTDKTFFQLLENTFGKVVTRIIAVLFALYFIFAAIIPMNEQQLLVHDSFYDTIPSIIVFLPFFVFSVYAGVKTLTNAGRCADICFPIFIVAVVCFIIMSTTETDLSGLLPVLKQPAGQLLGQTVGSLFRFSESAFLLMFMGHYKYKKGDAAKLTVSYAGGGLAVLILMMLYFGIYGALAPSRPFLISNISVFFPVVSFVGRIDLFLVYTFDIVVLFATVLNIQMSVHCLCIAFNRDLKILYSLLVNGILLVIMLASTNKNSALQAAATQWFWIPALVFAYIIPLFSWALRRKQK